MLLTALAPVATVQAAPEEASEYYYGVEYDWTSLDSDLQNVTGLDVQALFTEIMEDADEAGFNLDLGQLTTGSTNVYVHQTEDISAQTVETLNGSAVQVWSRTSDVTLRHGVLSNAIIMTDWSESTFGSDNTMFDIDVVATAENVLTVDMLYTEYLNDAYQLIGADMNFDMTVSADLDLGVDIALEGGGEELNVDFDTGIDVTYTIASTDAEWRLGNPSPIYIEAARNDYTDLACVLDADAVEVEQWDSREVTVYDMCGEISGTYAGTADYEASVSGLPMEEIGFDAGEFDLSISDNLAEAGNYSSDAIMDGVSLSMRADTPLQVDLGDGTNIDVVACDSCPPGSPVMFWMMGNVLGQASVAFGEAVAEDLEANLEDSVTEIFEEFFGLDMDDDYDDQPQFMCDDGESIPTSWVNDGYEDCGDGSDEDDFFVSVSSGDDSDFSLRAHFPDAVDLDSASQFMCDDGEEIPWNWVNDGGSPDCNDGSDEFDAEEPTTFDCPDGTTISFERVNDDVGDCSGFEDEGVDGLYTIQVTISDGEGNVLADVSDLNVCESYELCNATSTYYMTHLGNVPNPAGGAYGESTLCIQSSLTDAASPSVPMYVSESRCSISYSGPHVDSDVYFDGMTMNLEVWTHDWSQPDDVDLHVTVTNSADDELWTTIETLGGEDTFAMTLVSHELDVSDEGEYCMHTSLVQDGQTEPFWSETQCDDASMAGTPSDRLTTIAEALAESNLENVLTLFGENLESTLTTFDNETETPEFPYVDGMWAPLWSNEKATIVGVAVYGYDEDDNGYLITGPATAGFSSDLPMTFASIRYVTGVSAMEAQTIMMEADTLAEIVDVEQHDLSELEDALIEAGVDVSDLDLTVESDEGDGESSTEQTAEELAEEAGLLPFLSPLSMMAVLGLAFVAFGTRREHDE